MNKKNLLIITAHDDDEILGVGGAIQFFQEKNYNINICQVTDGSSTQYKDQPDKIKERTEQHKNALDIIKVKNVYTLDFPDMQLDTVPHYKINIGISKIINKIKPEIIFTHNPNDINKDHIEVYKSTIVATRPPLKFLKKIIIYEVPSSTEWNPLECFNPNYYINIDKYLDNKIKAFSLMKTEVKDYPHPRSLDGIKSLARYRGLQSGMEYAEAYKIIKQYD